MNRAVILFALIFCPSLQASQALSYKIIAEHPHDTQAFTQGLEFYQQQLFESSGRYGQSKVYSRSITNPQPNALANLHPSLFAEGISILDQKLYQLTWKAGKALVYSADDLSLLSHFDYQGQGWGLCNNGTELIMSNGSSQLLFINPQDFSISKRINVTDMGQAVTWLNELEWVEGKIYANIWRSDRIVIIDPQTGEVSAHVDLSGLLPKHLRTHNTNVLNGIAYQKSSKKLYVTGKNWPKLYQIELNAD